ncbi:hypothetical protein QBC38DRAFT_477637 [Podospora fimiseda]|uniref:Uncharacterized protein n=1 Tax=Podospora fimiseda TaxID=252190 RepID=A0AAN7BR09_9PEZI|nr:hypothetical protein QBC38DRAFT_477637 [Podospora fimiseda]
MSPTFKPTPIDAYIVKLMLNKAKGLPIEIIDEVLDYAEYWPSHTVEVNFGEDTPEVVRGKTGFRDDAPEDKFILRTPPLALRKRGGLPLHRMPLEPKMLAGEWSSEDFLAKSKSPVSASSNHPCRRIVFTLVSHDQGWGGRTNDEEDNGPYSHSWTWFEAGLERFARNEGDEYPSIALDNAVTVYPETEWDDNAGTGSFRFTLNGHDERKIQANITADNEYTTHVVAWDYRDDTDPRTDRDGIAKLQYWGRGIATESGNFVRNLRIGDMVTVWAKARFPAWSNNIASVKVEVFWAI